MGHLSQGIQSSVYSNTDYFFIEGTNIVEGANSIEFVQREPEAGIWQGFQDEKWAIRNILIDENDASNHAKSLMPSIMLLLNDNEGSPAPQ